MANIPGGQLGTFRQDKLLTPIDYSFFNPADHAAFGPFPTGEDMVPSPVYSMVVA